MISSYSGIDISVASVIFKLLDNKKLVLRSNINDNRKKNVEILNSGVNLFKKVNPLIINEEKKIFEKLQFSPISAL